MPPAAFDQKRACMRWIYAQRRLGLPLSPYHIERIVDALEMQIISRRAGQWPEVDSVQLEFNRSYFKRVRARLEGNDPGIFYRHTHSPISFDNASPTPNTTDDERPF